MPLDKPVPTTPERRAELLARYHEKVAAAAKQAPPVPPKGLGDYVAAGLSAIGITKERVAAVTGKPCGCAKRQEQLNELGRKFGIG